VLRKFISSLVIEYTFEKNFGKDLVSRALFCINASGLSDACDISVEKKVDFILISGDLFNTAIPSLDSLRTVVRKMKEIQDKDIPIYLISGSHDYSPSGKTMLDVLEEAGLCINVAKQAAIESSDTELGEEDENPNKLKLAFTKDRTGAKIVGLVGRRGGLEKSYYEVLDINALEREEGFKIFMFHSAIEEYKPEHLKQMEGIPLSMLPKGFDYYAAGHVHVVLEQDEPDHGKIVFPGPLFPNDFREMEQLRRGGFYIYNNGKMEFEPVQIYNIASFKIDCTDKTPGQIPSLVESTVGNQEFNNTIVTLRFFGHLKGFSSDIDWTGIMTGFYDKGAYFVMKNTAKLKSEEFEEIKTVHDSADEIETAVIEEHLGQVTLTGAEQERKLVKQLLYELDSEKQDGQKVYEFERSLLTNMSKWLEKEL